MNTALVVGLDMGLEVGLYVYILYVQYIRMALVAPVLPGADTPSAGFFI